MYRLYNALPILSDTLNAISIHLMYRLYELVPYSDRRYTTFQYISCIGYTDRMVDRQIRVLLFQYISCIGYTIWGNVDFDYET